MGAVKAHTWKDLIKQVEKSAKKFESSLSKNKWRVNNKGPDAAQFSQSKGKEMITLSCLGKLYQSRRGAMLAKIRISTFC